MWWNPAGPRPASLFLSVHLPTTRHGPTDASLSPSPAIPVNRPSVFPHATHPVGWNVRGRIRPTVRPALPGKTSGPVRLCRLRPMAIITLQAVEHGARRAPCVRLSFARGHRGLVRHGQPYLSPSPGTVSLHMGAHWSPSPVCRRWVRDGSRAASMPSDVPAATCAPDHPHGHHAVSCLAPIGTPKPVLGRRARVPGQGESKTPVISHCARASPAHGLLPIWLHASNLDLGLKATCASVPDAVLHHN